MHAAAAWLDLPVEVFGGVAHAVDAVIAREVIPDGVLQGHVVLLGHSWAPTHGTPNQAHPSLAVHLHPCDACSQHHRPCEANLACSGGISAGYGRLNSTVLHPEAFGR